MNFLRIKPQSLAGQALLELALFGSILLMLLGVMVSFGMRYSYQQKAMMGAFRKTLNESAVYERGGQASVTTVSDEHIPNPANPFAIGSVSPFISGASVVRSYKLHENADTEEDLPQMTIQIQGRPFSYKTAGFIDLGNITASLDKYEEIYGGTNVFERPKKSGNYTVIDSCRGEIISYDSCKRQCRLITEVPFCVRECVRGREPKSKRPDCYTICSQTVEVPPYCEDGALENIFAFAIATGKPRVMGLQADTTKEVSINSALQKQESAGTITTTDTIDWSDDSHRQIITREGVTNVTTTVGEDTTQTWTANN